MDKVKNRLTKISRANRVPNFDPASSSTSSLKKRSHSISGVLESDHTPSSPVPPPQQLQLLYHGYMCVDDPRSNKEVLGALRAVREGSNTHSPHSISYGNGTLRVAEGDGDALLVCPLHSVALVIHDVNKGGFNDCFVVSFGTGHYTKQCHIFQAKSFRETADIVQVLQKAVRNANKERKVRKSTESRPTKPKISVSEGPKVSRAMQNMEDEDEVIEHKSIGGRRESKKAILAMVRTASGEPTSNSASLAANSGQVGLSSEIPSSSLHPTNPAPLPLKDKRKLGQRKSGGAKSGGTGDQGEFTRKDKVDQLVGAIERIQENNVFLREKARKITTPTTIFEDALHAMVHSNYELLQSYMSHNNVPDTHDGSGNTLLHYAVALGSVHGVKILYSNNASLEASGWNDCKPVHRAAVAEGHTSILQTLLRHGAEVNSLDFMRRTPLHFSSARLELMECSIALLEFGAHVLASDILGLRPFDLDPELKEARNRLVISACETFMSVPLKDGGKEPLDEGTPYSLSPASSRPNSSLDDHSQDSWGGGRGDNDLNQLVEKVGIRARDIAHRAHARRKEFQKSMEYGHSLSHGNLMDLREGEEDVTMQRNPLKFPSAYAIDSNYYEIIDKEETTIHALRDLIRTGKMTKKSSVDKERKENGLVSSLSEPELHIKDDGNPPPGPCPTQEMRSLMRENLTKFKADSGSSSGTLREGEDSENMLQLSRAFDVLQDDLKRSSFRKSEDDLKNVTPLSDQLTCKLRHPHCLSADATPLMKRRTKEETAAIFDELISQMEGATDILCSRNQNDTHTQDHSHSKDDRSDSHSPYKDDQSHSHSPNNDVYTGTGQGESFPIAKRRVQSSDVPKSYGLVRPSSSAGVNKGGEQEDPAPRAASVESDLLFCTLPKKKKFRKKWRIGSPLFRSRRKSFNTSANHAPSHVSVTGPSPSVPVHVCMTEKEVPPQTPLSTTHSKSDLLELPQRSDNSRSGSPGSTDMNDRLASIERTEVGGVIGTLGKIRRSTAPRDECLDALKLMTTLSSNEECLSGLISYICLPKYVTKLVEISQSPSTSLKVLDLISTLLSNLYHSGGSEGTKTALGSGVLDLTIKLLQSRDPIPGTCLSLLNNLLISDNDNDCLRTIIRIPTAPLLQYLEVSDSGESDSGYENNSTHPRRDITVSKEMQYSSDTMSTATDEGVGGMGTVGNYLGLPPHHSGARTSSFTSETSETSSGHSFLSPSLPGQSSDIPLHLDPRRIVLKMLAVSSTHSKMQLALSAERAMSLLASCTSDLSQENVTNSLITLANVAQNVGSHDLFHRLGVVKKLQSLLFQGPHPRYHASRALVYMGHLDLLLGCGLFDLVATGYETDTVINTTDNDGHVYARGATIEKCVELLTSEPSKLWGGFSLQVGPHPPANKSFPALHASKDQIIQFFLTTYKSFVHPLIFMRLLLHRLTYNDSLNLFDWSKAPEESASPTIHLLSVPPTQMNVLNLIGRWLETYSCDFTEYPQLKAEVDKVVSRLKSARGPYIPHTHRLRSLLQDADRPRTEQVDQMSKAESRPPHHDNLYNLCRQMVTGGHLPVTVDQAVFMASLQLHLENISNTPSVDPSGTLTNSTPGTPSRNKRGTAKLKSAFPPGYSKSKNIMKRVKTQMAEFEKLSERNAKHLYIERCQANPGYDCSFFSVRVPSSGRFKRAPVAKQLMGINNKRIVFLDEKTKDLITSHSLQSVSSITRESDPCVLLINIRGDAAGFKVQVDSTTVAKEVANILEECREGERMLDESALRWSDSVPSLFTMSIETTPDTDSSLSTADHTSTEREATPPGHMLSYDMLKNPPEGGVVAAPNGRVDTLLTYKSDTLKAFSHNDSLVTDLCDHIILSDREKLLFCDCPPDPEIPPGLNLNNITLVDVLSSPKEIARQMTLIAHKRLCELTSTELLKKVNLLPNTSSQQQQQQRDSFVSTRSSVVDGELQETAVEKLASRFNQVGNWVAHSILQFEHLEERVEVIQQFISIAKNCYELGNYSSMMAIVVTGLGSAPIRRLHHSWSQVPKPDMELFKEMDTILDSRGNYKHYREKLAATEVPAIPYVGVFLKDLTFICDGNPDYLRGGLINIHKRRQVYRLLEEIHHYQKDDYKLHDVPELQRYLCSHQLVPEDDLHSMSHNVEPRIRRSHSSSSTKSFSSTQGGRSFFRGLTRSGSSSSSYIHRTSASN